MADTPPTEPRANRESRNIGAPSKLDQLRMPTVMGTSATPSAVPAVDVGLRIIDQYAVGQLEQQDLRVVQVQDLASMGQDRS